MSKKEEEQPLVSHIDPLQSDSGAMLPRSAGKSKTYYDFNCTRVIVIAVAILISLLLAMVAVAVVLIVYFTKESNDKKMPSFGHEMKEKKFTMDMNAYILNHGSYGAAALPIQEASLSYFAEMNLNTHEWFSNKMRPMLDETRGKYAEYVNADEDDLVIIENASTGVNSVLRSFNFTSTDGIIYLEYEYPMTENVLQFVHERYGVSLYKTEIHLPTTKEDIIKEVEAEFAEHGKNITFCVFDHITSTPAVILPIKELAELCHSHGAPILIDGAHAIGQIDVDLIDLDVDFYLTNIHKWLCGVPGTALLYVQRKWQSLIYPAIISTTYDPFLLRFRWQGTRDASGWMSMRAALDFRELLTDAAVHEYNNGLCKRVAEHLTQAWDTGVPVPYDMTASLINVEIPCNGQQPDPCYDWNIGTVNGQLQAKKIWTVIFDIAGVRYFRISCQIYNEFSEYLHLQKEFEKIVGL